MHRRSFLALAAVTPLAGCTSLLGGGVDTTLSEGELVEFDADEGAELTVTVDVVEIEQPGDDDDLTTDEADVERDSVGFQIRHDEEGVVDTWSVEDTEEFDITIEHGGSHSAMVMSGEADVTIS
ncbi:hypothetical protein [Natronolimnobius baerhuensis]|uniref:Uncharacterized protein n=1 Tax=Natronolimnobius baerhuensis TaxID=253108 RepID=A0A202E5N0_9EURY|nr:hypothetical protein [Natronolimnobius baerhuensis]OVE83549.1 hypothetical protein B2G88_14005 [Natronolimnobius baerhuensis]